MPAIEKIISWAQDLPEWQADAVRRFLEQGDLTASDKNELYQLLKAEFEIDTTSIAPHPPHIGSIAGTASTSTPILLQRISDINNVSAIEDGASIPFGHTGVTVIYGENGSGKSSYARILKKACRARDTKDKILPNVFSEEDTGPASATIRITQDLTRDIDLPWVDGEQSDRRLSSVSFFDSRCARVIVDEKNDATYIPYGCEVFDALGELVTNFKARLENEKPPTKIPNSDSILDHTESAIFLKNINRNTKATEIKVACGWEETDDSQLESMVSRLASSSSKGLLKESQRVQTIAERTRFLLSGIKTAQATLNTQLISRINETLVDIRAKQKAVSIAANNDLRNEKLKVGDSDEWKQLYTAAKHYSEKIAYPESDFPRTELEDLCVLCHQNIDEDTKERLKKFKSFMENKSGQALQRTIETLNTTVASVNTTIVPQAADYGNVLDELAAADRKLVENALKDLQNLKDELGKTTAETKSVDIKPLAKEVSPPWKS